MIVFVSILLHKRWNIPKIGLNQFYRNVVRMIRQNNTWKWIANRKKWYEIRERVLIRMSETLVCFMWYSLENRFNSTVTYMLTEGLNGTTTIVAFSLESLCLCVYVSVQMNLSESERYECWCICKRKKEINSSLLLHAWHLINCGYSRVNAQGIVRINTHTSTHTIAHISVKNGSFNVSSVIPK